MSSTIPRFVGVRRYMRTGGVPKNNQMEFASQGRKALSKKRTPFETDCIFRECITHNNNHIYNLSRYDFPAYYFEE